jgi:hypothetical protein
LDRGTLQRYYQAISSEITRNKWKAVVISSSSNQPEEKWHENIVEEDEEEVEEAVEEASPEALATRVKVAEATAAPAPERNTSLRPRVMERGSSIHTRLSKKRSLCMYQGPSRTPMTLSSHSSR